MLLNIDRLENQYRVSRNVKEQKESKGNTEIRPSMILERNFTREKVERRFNEIERLLPHSP